MIANCGHCGMTATKHAIQQHLINNECPKDPRKLAMAAEASEGTKSDLERWWTAQAAAEAPEIARKAAEYGSSSLEELGRHVAKLQGRTVTSAEALELGCWINAVQKVERWTDAVLRGETGKADSIHDLSVYARMSLRIKDVGGWPGEGAGPEAE